LPISAYELYENGKFYEIYDDFLDLSNFKDDLEISQFFMQNEDYWLAILFSANFFVTNLKLIAKVLGFPTRHTNYAAEINHVNNLLHTVNESLGVNKTDLSIWLKLIENTKKQDNNIFQKNDIMQMLQKINSFSSGIKNRLWK